MPVLHEQLRQAEAILEASGVASPRVDAIALAAHLLGIPDNQVGLRRREQMDAEFTRRYKELVERRAQRVPLQHLLGRAWFGPHEMQVGEGVFIPRPETELLAHWAAQQAFDGALVLDVCTGTGAIAAYVAGERRKASVYAVELSEAAASYAERNLAGRATLIRGDALDLETYGDLLGRVNVLVCNPPYVPESQDLQPEVYHDPHMAVFSGQSGMDFLQQWVPIAAALLVPGGVVGVEHDDSRAQATRELFAESGQFDDISNVRDLAGRERFVMASKVSADKAQTKPSIDDGVKR
nr:peptide chain release factor N(5)-glutamine methyltransferase [Corynebacterium sp. 76QC2CO]